MGEGSDSLSRGCYDCCGGDHAPSLPTGSPFLTGVRVVTRAPHPPTSPLFPHPSSTPSPPSPLSPCSSISSMDSLALSDDDFVLGLLSGGLDVSLAGRGGDVGGGCVDEKVGSGDFTCDDAWNGNLQSPQRSDSEGEMAPPPWALGCGGKCESGNQCGLCLAAVLYRSALRVPNTVRSPSGGGSAYSQGEDLHDSSHSVQIPPPSISLAQDGTSAHGLLVSLQLAAPARLRYQRKSRKRPKTRASLPHKTRKRNSAVGGVGKIVMFDRWVWDPINRSAQAVRTVSSIEGFTSREEAEEFGLLTDHDPPPSPFEFHKNSLDRLFTLTTDFGSEAAAAAAVQFVLTFICGLFFLRRRWLARGAKAPTAPFMISHFTNYSNAITSRATRKARKGLTSIRSLEKVPDSSYLAFTDGSAIPNPGPSGAGAWISAPGNSPDYIYQSLGHGSNNFGELWAIGMALQYYIDKGYTHDIVIASDSEWAIGKLSKGFGSRQGEHDDAIKSIKRLMTSIVAPIEFIWVHAHSGLKQNEVADKLAKKGSRSSKATGIPTRCHSNGFSYLVQRGVEYHLPPD